MSCLALLVLSLVLGMALLTAATLICASVRTYLLGRSLLHANGGDWEASRVSVDNVRLENERMAEAVLGGVK